MIEEKYLEFEACRGGFEQRFGGQDFDEFWQGILRSKQKVVMESLCYWKTWNELVLETRFMCKSLCFFDVELEFISRFCLCKW